MKKIIIFIIVLITICFFGFNGPYKYDNSKTVAYITKHKSLKSRSMCAWYSMKAIRNGGCYYCYIYPGYAYNKILPKLGFEEISTENYIPKAGDISVLPKNSNSCFGHIAIYNGSNWISDFKQDDIFPGKSYKISGKYQIFRIEDGWHWASVFPNFYDIKEYIETLVIGFNRIKW